MRWQPDRPASACSVSRLKGRGRVDARWAASGPGRPCAADAAGGSHGWDGCRQSRERRKGVEQLLTISITWGKSDPTKATIPFQLARGAKQAGIEVRIVLAGDSTDLIRSGVAWTVRGPGC